MTYYKYPDFCNIEILLEAAQVYEKTMPGRNSSQFRKIIDDYIEHGISLDDSFGLNKTLSNKWHFSIRDRFLIEARSHVYPENDVGDYGVSRIISEEINKFRKKLETCDISELESQCESKLSICIYRAFEYSIKKGIKQPPRGVAAIHAIYTER